MRYKFDSLCEDSRSKSKSRPVCLDGIIQWSQWCFWGNIFGGIPRTSPMALAQHHLRRCCRRFAVTHLPQCEFRSHFPHLLLFPSLPFPFPPLSSSLCKYHLFWRFLSCSSSPLCRFFRSFQLLSGRFSMSALWWQWSLDWNCKLYFFLAFFSIVALFRCVIVARVFRFFPSFSKQEFTHTIYVNIWTHLHRSAYEFVWNTINGL